MTRAEQLIALIDMALDLAVNALTFAEESEELTEEQIRQLRDKARLIAGKLEEI